MLELAVELLLDDDRPFRDVRSRFDRSVEASEVAPARNALEVDLERKSSLESELEPSSQSVVRESSFVGLRSRGSAMSGSGRGS